MFFIQRRFFLSIEIVFIQRNNFIFKGNVDIQKKLITFRENLKYKFQIIYDSQIIYLLSCKFDIHKQN